MRDAEQRPGRPARQPGLGAVLSTGRSPSSGFIFGVCLGSGSRRRGRPTCTRSAGPRSVRGRCGARGRSRPLHGELRPAALCTREFCVGKGGGSRPALRPLTCCPAGCHHHRHRDSELTLGPAAPPKVSLSVCCWTLKDLGGGEGVFAQGTKMERFPPYSVNVATFETFYSHGDCIGCAECEAKTPKPARIRLALLFLMRQWPIKC